MVAIRRGSATAAGMRGTRMNRPAQSEVHRGDTPTGGRQLGRAFSSVCKHWKLVLNIRPTHNAMAFALSSSAKPRPVAPTFDRLSGGSCSPLAMLLDGLSELSDSEVS